MKEIKAYFCKGWPFSAKVAYILKALWGTTKTTPCFFYRIDGWQYTAIAVNWCPIKGAPCVLAYLSGYMLRCPLKFRFPGRKWYADNGLDKAKGIAGPLSPFFLLFSSLRRSFRWKYVCKHPVILGRRHILWAARNGRRWKLSSTVTQQEGKALQDVRLLRT